MIIVLLIEVAARPVTELDLSVTEQELSLVSEMVHADAKEWAKIDGVGKLTAQKAVAALNGGVN